MGINTSKIPLTNGAELVVQTCDYGHLVENEIAVCIWKDGICVQDICTIRPEIDEGEDVEVLVWGDESMEDYTHKFIIPQYKETE